MEVKSKQSTIGQMIFFPGGYKKQGGCKSTHVSDLFILDIKSLKL